VALEIQYFITELTEERCTFVCKLLSLNVTQFDNLKEFLLISKVLKVQVSIFITFSSS